MPRVRFWGTKKKKAKGGHDVYPSKESSEGRTFVLGLSALGSKEPQRERHWYWPGHHEVSPFRLCPAFFFTFLHMVTWVHVHQRPQEQRPEKNVRVDHYERKNKVFWDNHGTSWLYLWGSWQAKDRERGTITKMALQVETKGYIHLRTAVKPWASCLFIFNAFVMQIKCKRLQILNIKLDELRDKHIPVKLDLQTVPITYSSLPKVFSHLLHFQK